MNIAKDNMKMQNIKYVLAIKKTKDSAWNTFLGYDMEFEDVDSAAAVAKSLEDEGFATKVIPMYSRWTHPDCRPSDERTIER
jgi:hypothetical protein